FVYLPNSFTPNGDGVNDVFGARTEGSVAGFELQVFNRWGERIWSTEDPGSAWDGAYEGQLSPDGVYPTLLRYRADGGERVSRLGHVVLLR
ncbi:MAG: gliding motility-associated C-terminal domain-containing protein, partial [Flavobacteriales bacterium]